MNEATKCRPFREAAGEFEKYLHGKGIDIGCGADPLTHPGAEVTPWDTPQGDAKLLAGVPDEIYDFVFSGHCLEHLTDVEEALKNWMRVLRPGGYLYVVVPDLELYEHNRWPSQHNPDHKFSFSRTLLRQIVGRSNHYHIGNDVRPLVEKLGGMWVEDRLEDSGYNRADTESDQTLGPALAQICFIAWKPSSWLYPGERISPNTYRSGIPEGTEEPKHD